MVDQQARVITDKVGFNNNSNSKFIASFIEFVGFV